MQRPCGGRDIFEDMEGGCCSCSGNRECKKHGVGVRDFVPYKVCEQGEVTDTEGFLV